MSACFAKSVTLFDSCTTVEAAMKYPAAPSLTVSEASGFAIASKP